MHPVCFASPLILNSLLLILCSIFIPSPALGQRPFIRVEGTRFMEGDRPFYFVGANLNVMHGKTARAGAAATIAAAAGDGLRVGRLWALGEGPGDSPAWKRQDFLFRDGPGGWQNQAYLQLDRVIAEAGRRGLRLVITLSNRWSDYGGVPMYLRWAKQVDVTSYGYTDRFFADPRCRKWFLEHVQRIVGRTNTVTGVPYAKDPTIMAWELQNEMVGTPEAAAVRRRWFSEVARQIRRLDGNHLVVPGLIGYDLQKERQAWIEMCRLPGVSYCDQHIYPEEHLRSRGARNMRRYVDDRVQLAHNVVGKPVVFGEFGFADRGRRSARARWHRLFLQRLFFDGGNGAMAWIYQPTLTWKRRYGILVDDPRYRLVRRALASTARRLSRRSPRCRNRAINKRRGMRPLAPTHALMVRQRGVHRAWDARGVLSIPVDRFHSAWFEEAGSWAGGVLVHAYGRRTGWLEYRFRGPGFTPSSLRIRARLSSEYPGSAAPADGHSRVQLLLDRKPAGEVRVMPDDGVGAWHVITITDARILRRLRRGTHSLRFVVRPGELANGVAIYGREAPLNREPVDGPGPLQLVAERSATP